MTFEEILKNKETGIYKITNKVSNNAYIGQARKIGVRIKAHLYSAMRPGAKDYNYPIHIAIRKYGIDAFSFEIVERCTSTELNDRERYWISYYNTRAVGYNQTDGGNQGIRHIKLTKADVMLIIAELRAFKTDLEIAKQFHVSKDMVHRINGGRSWYDPNLVYPIRPDTADALALRSYTGFCIGQYSLDGTLLGKFTSTHQAAQKLFGDDRKHAHIAACIRGDRKSAWGFQWQSLAISINDWVRLCQADN